MFPKNTVNPPVVMPAEKPSQVEKKDTTVLYVIDGEQNQESSRNQRTLIRACAVVLTTLILVGGALGAVAIVYQTHHADPTTIDIEPTPQYVEYLGELMPGNNPEVWEPRDGATSKPRIKIDDGGLWPINKPTLTPDLIAIDDGLDQDIHIGDGNAVPVGEEVPDGNNDITVVGGDEVTDLVLVSSYQSSSTSSASSSEDDYENGRTYISSSFPYDGFYMRGGVGDLPDSLKSSVVIEPESSGDFSGNGAMGDQEDDTPETAFQEKSWSSDSFMFARSSQSESSFPESNSLSSSDSYVVSE